MISKKTLKQLATVGLIFSFVLLVSGCFASKTVKKTAQASSCSCSEYLPKAPRPSWVDGEGVKSGIYVSNGIAECSGIQSMDFKEADMAARANLSRILSSRVESEVVLIRKDYGGGKGHSSGKITTKQSTNSILEKSAIFDRWIDPKSCVIYAAVRVSDSDIKAAIQKEREMLAKKLRNKSFVVTAQGEYQQQLNEHLTQALVNSGVTRIKQQADAETFNIDAKIVSHQLTNRDRLAKVRLLVTIKDPAKNTVWTHQIKGKGVSFGAQSGDQLILKAIEQAIGNIDDSFEQALERSVD